MVRRSRNAVLVGAMAVTCAGLWGLPAAAVEPPQPLTLRGVVERVPDTPNRHGQWVIDGRAVMVGPETRLEEDPADVENEGYWTQAATGVVVRAPGWTPETAHAAGFRQALREEVGAIGLGRLVKAKVRPDDEGGLQAIEIELHD